VPTSLPTPRLTTANRIGLGLAAFLGLADVVLTFVPVQEGVVGPPQWIVVLSGLLGFATLLAVAVAWRKGGRAALGIIAITRVLSMLTALPAFFVDVPAVVTVLVGVFVVLTVVCVVLVLAPVRRTTTIAD
jgi:hypothetical protein